MSTATTDERFAAWRSLTAAYTAIALTLADEMEAATGLKPEWYEIMLHLYEAEDQHLRMHELADKRLLSRSSATRLIDRMCESGLVKREIDERDRRGTLVSLTDTGRAEFVAAGRIHLRGIQHRFSDHISSDEALQLTALMQRLAAANKTEA